METLIFDGNNVVDLNSGGLRFDNRGVLFGETIFTTFRTYNGKILFLDDHLSRLKMNLDYFYSENIFKWETLRRQILQGILQLQQTLQNSEMDISLRITLYPFNEDRTDLGKKPDSIKFFITANPIDYSLKAISEITVAFDVCKQDKSNQPACIKIGSYMESAKMLRNARERGFEDVVLVNQDNILLEGVTSNLFFRLGNTIYTPDVKAGILDGVTRSHFIKCLKENAWEIKEGFYTKNDLLNADEAWLSSSVKGIRVISCIEQKQFIKPQHAEAFTKQLISLFESYCKNYEE